MNVEDSTATGEVGRGALGTRVAHATTSALVTGKLIFNISQHL